MAKTTAKNAAATRQHLLQAALRRFAEHGYAATSIQQIVDDARVSKPALYYHFPDKARLFEALVDQAHDERYELMRAAAERGESVGARLTEVVAAVFAFTERNRDLMRLAFATAFATQGDVPQQNVCREKGRRNFEFIRSLIAEGLARGELDRSFTSEELAMGIYGSVTAYVMGGLILGACPLDRRAAERAVELFLQGAAAQKAGVPRRPSARR